MHLSISPERLSSEPWTCFPCPGAWPSLATRYAEAPPWAVRAVNNLYPNKRRTPLSEWKRTHKQNFYGCYCRECHKVAGFSQAQLWLPGKWKLFRVLTHLKRPWCWKRLKAGGEGDDRGWAGWMASPTQWTWVWVNSGSWWWTGRPGVLQSMGSQRAEHDWATEMNWTDWMQGCKLTWNVPEWTPKSFCIFPEYYFLN